MSAIPTKPGFYWRKGPNHDGEVVEQIVKVDIMIRSIPNELFYWEVNGIGGIFVKEEPDVEWYGPMYTLDELNEIDAELCKIYALLDDFDGGVDASLEVRIRNILARILLSNDG